MTIEKWEIDSSHSGIHFSVRHLVIAKVRGQFARWSGTISAQAGDPSSGSVSVVIDASSIDTGVADRDAHLKSADFLDVAKHPEITFNSSRVEKVNDHELKIVASYRFMAQVVKSCSTLSTRVGPKILGGMNAPDLPQKFPLIARNMG